MCFEQVAFSQAFRNLESKEIDGTEVQLRPGRRDFDKQSAERLLVFTSARLSERR